MNSITYKTIPIAEIRSLAKQFTSYDLEQCMLLVLTDKMNPCFEQEDKETVMNVLAKAGYITKLTESGLTEVQAMRHLGKQMRSLQV